MVEKIRNRVRELRRVKASELVPNRKNWRRHPKEQSAALKGLLAEVGYADALIRELPDGRLMLLDGHLRAETTKNAMVPTRTRRHRGGSRQVTADARSIGRDGAS